MDVIERRPRGGGPAAMVGPLGSYESLVRDELTRAGYAGSSVYEAVGSMRSLSFWMTQQGLACSDLTSSLVEEFLNMRRRYCRTERTAVRRLGSVLWVLRRKGVVPAADGAEVTPVVRLLAEYRAWLIAERGVSAGTVRCYCDQAKKFLSQLAEPLESSLAGLDAASVTRFVVEQVGASRCVWSAKSLVTATRSMLRFLHVQGLVSAPFAAAVPTVAGWRLNTLPRGLDRRQVQAVLAAPDPKTVLGLRDRAVLICLAGLGLRGAELAGLRLDDLDWRHGEVVVRGKGSRVDRLPLPAVVGEALAAYLTSARPRCVCATVFVTVRAPFRPLSPHAVQAIMGRACQRAGLARLGTHRLRHTLATDLLRAGASLTEVGQVLRHRSQLSTMAYAKVDDQALRALARPWQVSQ